MDNVREKLARCFVLAFPQMDPRQCFAASAENTKEWDSVAQVTLITLIGEEFGIDADFEEFEGATSFEAIAKRISEISTGA